MAESPSNQPTGYVRYNRSGSKLQEWSGSAWVDVVFSVAGGGTGGSTASAARTALGLGSMATQDNTSVNITGGTISGVSMNASVLTAGTVALNRGGTGASLSLGSIGQPMMSNGSGVVFADGDQIAKLNASNLTTGTVPLARLSGITNTQIDAAAAIAWSKISKSGALFSDLGGTLPGSALSGGVYSGLVSFTGTIGVDSLGVVSGASFAGTTTITNTLQLNSLPKDFNAVVQPTTGHIQVNIDGTPYLIAFY